MTTKRAGRRLQLLRMACWQGGMANSAFLFSARVFQNSAFLVARHAARRISRKHNGGKHGSFRLLVQKKDRFVHR